VDLPPIPSGKLQDFTTQTYPMKKMSIHPPALWCTNQKLASVHLRIHGTEKTTAASTASS
ncbi:hypothetical protein NDU88_005090, partial [Pleurodeles waltl]